MQEQQHPGQIGEYWLSKRRGSDNWCRTWYDSATRQTRRASLGTENFREAQLKLAEWVTKNATFQEQNAEELHLEAVLVRYYENHARYIRSAETTRNALRKWSDYFAEATISDLTLDAQESFIRSLHSRGYSDSYIQRIITAGKAALNRAYQNGEIKTIPYIKTVTATDRRERVLSSRETADLFNAIENDHILMYCVLAFNTLARPETILELRCFQVDFENRLIRLNAPGRKQTKKYRPTIPITDTLLPWLRQGKCEYFVHWHGKPIRSIKTSWRILRKKAGLSVDVIPYTIRHTMATELRKRGVPPWEVSGMLGHRSEYKTTEIYAHYAPDYLGDAAGAIDEYFRELRPHLNRRIRMELGKQRVSCVLVDPPANSQPLDYLERETRLELATPTLARLCSTN